MINLVTVLESESIIKRCLKENEREKRTMRIVDMINKAKALKEENPELHNVDHEVWACLNACGHLNKQDFFRMDGTFEEYEHIMDLIEFDDDFDEEYAEGLLYKKLLCEEPEENVNEEKNEENEEDDEEVDEYVY